MKKVVFFMLISIGARSQIILEALEGGIPNDCFKTSTIISQTPCSVVSGATINDDAATPLGVEYNWTGATGYVDQGTVRALVEINGQCWFKRNAITIPSVWGAVSFPGSGNFDYGGNGYYNYTYTAGNGRLYQWSAAMNWKPPIAQYYTSSASQYPPERSRGICPVGWHVPSDCEFQFLEQSTQMPSQILGNDGTYYGRTFLSSTGIGSASYLGLGFPQSNNNTGFSLLFSGYNNGQTGTFGGYNQQTGFWTSTMKSWNSTHNLSTFYRRDFFKFYVGIGRGVTYGSYGYAVRCLKD